MLTSLQIGPRRKRYMLHESGGRMHILSFFLMLWDIVLIMSRIENHSIRLQKPLERRQRTTVFWFSHDQDVFLEYNRPLKLLLVLHLIIQYRIFLINYQHKTSVAVTPKENVLNLSRNCLDKTVTLVIAPECPLWSYQFSLPRGVMFLGMLPFYAFTN